MSYAKGNFAFFDGTSPDFRKVLELEGSIADFKVIAITPKSVTHGVRHQRNGSAAGHANAP